MTDYEELMKAVNEKAAEFNVHIEKVKRANDALFVHSANVLEALGELFGSVRPSSKKCTVCYTRDQKVACVPCGHCFCQSCADRGRRRCHTCRQAVTDLMRVYF